jgi:hypothetical protein
MRPDVFIPAIPGIAVAIAASIFVGNKAGLMWTTTSW